MISCLLLSSKFKAVYRLVYKFEQLLDEVKRLLMIFPEAVIIQGNNKEGKREITFKNQAFENMMSEIGYEIDNLSNMSVTIEKDKSEDSVSSNLFDLIKDHERELKTKSIVEQHKVKLKSKSVEDSSFYAGENTDNPEKVYKIFNIKSLHVDWAESKDAILHVFIDTTNLYKLEEANTSIR